MTLERVSSINQCSANSPNDQTTTEVAEELSDVRIQQGTFVDERVVTEESPFIAPPSHSLAFGTSDSMSSMHIAALDVFRNPLLLSTTTWASTQVPGTEIASFSFPQVFESTLILSTIYSMLLQMYSYFKFEANIRVVINATKFHSGKLIVCYDPVQTTGSVEKPLNIYSASCLPNIIIDAADSNSGVIDIPFEHILSYMSTNSTEPAPQMGTVHLLVLNSLGAAAATPPSIQVNTFVYCTNVGLEVPIRPHRVTFTSLAEAPFVTEGFMSALSTAANMAGSSSSSEGGGKFSNLVSKGVTGLQGVGGAISGTIDNLKTGNFSGMLSSIGDGLKSALGIFNLDKPALPDVKIGNMLAPVAPLAHMKGVDTSVRLGPTNVGGYLESDFSSAPSDELAIPQIIRRPTLADQIPWLATQVEGTQIFKIPVHPGYCNYSSVPGKLPAAFLLNPTYLSYLSTFYDQWKGSLNFRFDFASSQFHSGRLQFVFEPNSKLDPLIPPATTVQDFSNSPEVIFDLRENKTVSINIPYVSTTVRKFSRSGPFVADRLTTDEADLYMLGYLYINVLTPLVAPDNVAADISFNVYVSAGEDFSLHVPRIPIDFMFANDIARWPNEPPFVTESAASSDTPSRTTLVPDGHSIIKGTNKISLSDPYAEACADVRDLARRYCLKYTGGLPLVPTTRPSTGVQTYPRHEGYLMIDTSMSSGPTGTGIGAGLVLNSRDFLYCMSRLYAFWTGSYRFKFIPSVSRTVPLRATGTYLISGLKTIPSDPTPFDVFSGAYTGHPAHTTLCSQDVALELEVPYYSPYQQLLTHIHSLGDSNLHTIKNGLLNVYLSTTDISQLPLDNAEPPRPVVDFDLYRAAGDDFMFRFLVSPPQILRSDKELL